MASRAPLDLRVNTLKAKREKVLASTAHLGTMPTPWSPIGLRIELGADARNPAFTRRRISSRGCRGAGRRFAARGLAVRGKTRRAGDRPLRRRRRQDPGISCNDAGQGRLIATDHDKRQLAPIYERLSRAGVHNCEVRTPKGPSEPLSDIHASADLVLIDAPAPEPAPGGAIRMPNGGCGPARSKSV